jgi:hypothetical protein
MTPHSVDSLLEALKCSVSEAQKSLSKRHCGELRRIYTDDSGKALTWTFYIPSPQGDEEHYTPIELPLVSLRSNYELNITSLAVEVDSEIVPASRRMLTAVNEQSAQPTAPSSSPKRLAMIIRRTGRRIRKSLTRIRFMISGREELHSEIRINGKLLKQD